MNFISVSFLIFLISIFTLYWALKKRSWQNALLLGASYLFYSWWDYRFCSLMLISTIVDYTMGLGIANSTSLARKRTFLALSIVTNLGLLGVFK
ncbi:MAG: MBOAT family protein, partial [Prochloron sp. SP5CPC1]|nr:MBOAT family protein [Candidatus Paraprochloron terpiosi SP5CPC1]